MRENPKEKTIDRTSAGCYTSLTAPCLPGAREEGITISETQEAEEWLTVPEAAEQRNISRQTVREAILNGSLRAEAALEDRAGRVFYRIRRDWLDAWIEEIARYGKGRRPKNRPKAERPARHELTPALI